MTTDRWLRSRIRMRESTGEPVPGWVRMAGGVVVVVGAVELAVLECFLVPLHLDVVPVPLAPLMAVVGNIAGTRLMYRATGHRLASVLPVVLWLLVVLVFAARGPGGDLVVPGTVMGMVFLFGGTLAGAFAAGQVLALTTPSRR